MISLAIWCKLAIVIFKDYKLHSLKGLCNFVVSEKFTCLFALIEIKIMLLPTYMQIGVCQRYSDKTRPLYKGALQDCQNLKGSKRACIPRKL